MDQLIFPSTGWRYYELPKKDSKFVDRYWRKWFGDRVVTINSLGKADCFLALVNKGIAEEEAVVSVRGLENSFTKRLYVRHESENPFEKKNENKSKNKSKNTSKNNSKNKMKPSKVPKTTKKSKKQHKTQQIATRRSTRLAEIDKDCENIKIIKSPDNKLEYEKKFDKAVELFNKFAEPRKDMPVYPVLSLYGAVYTEIVETYM